MQDPIDDADI